MKLPQFNQVKDLHKNKFKHLKEVIGLLTIQDLAKIKKVIIT